MKNLSGVGLTALGLAVILIVVALFLMRGNILVGHQKTVHQFVIPDGLLPTSIDPIAIDQFNNYFPGQMIYTQPLTASTRGELTSQLLGAFDYDRSQNKISFAMKSGTRPIFSDGTEITANDVAFAIARLAYSRPKFPVLRFIKGLDVWRQDSSALSRFPDGIVVDDDRIDIYLTKPQLNPLFRLTLNVVSVIPRRCVDVKTNSLICTHPPVSGFYKETGRTQDHVSYEKRTNTASDAVEKINISYPKVGRNIVSYLENIDENSVVWLYDLDFSPDEYRQIESKFQIFRLAEAWFTGFVLNPRVKPFDDLSFRRWFVQLLQARIKTHHRGPTVYSQSIFPEIVPGFIKDEDFKIFSFTDQEIAGFKSKLTGFTFFWGIRKAEPPPVLLAALQELAKDYGFHLMAPTVAVSSHSGFESYANERTVLQTSNSGFWPLDPAGDVQMLFTPQLHQDYKDIWSDDKLNDLMTELAESVDLKNTENVMRKINLYLHDQAIFNIFSHYGYFYLRKPKTSVFVHSGAVSLTMPYPWQVFGHADR